MGESRIIQPSKTCIYCGEPLQGVRKGEHIVQKALGCTRTLRRVCGDCNNKFSKIDKELVSNSYLKFVASDELDRTEHEVWDYNQELDVALEAHMLPEYRAPVLWPQVILDRRKCFFQADLDEMKSAGPERYFKKFYHFMMIAREDLRADKKRPRWRWERVLQPPRRGRFPPRIYTPHTFCKFSGKVHFNCRYAKDTDKDRLLWQLDKWNPLAGRLELHESLGVIDPESQRSFYPRHVLRALVKIGINLLAKFCIKTVVTKDTFGDAIGCVLYDHDGPTEQHSGFVLNEDIEFLECPKDAHKFCLVHDGHWTLHCAFFGGRIGATVAFPGPNDESWKTATITAPLKPNKWTVEKSSIIHVRKMRVEWADVNKIVPSLPFQNVECKVRFEPRKRTN